MRGPTHLRRSVLAAALLVLTACTAAISTGDDQADVVDVFTVYRGNEAAAFRAVLDDFTAQTGIAARHVGTAGFADRLRERVADGDPPDVALVPQPAIVEEFAAERQLVALDDTVEVEVDDDYVLGVDAAIFGGRRFGVVFRLEVKSLVWYPPAAFREAGLEAPGTWSGLLALTEQVEVDDGAPWCMGMEAVDATGYIGTDWIEDLMLRLHGPSVYDAWVAGDQAFTSDEVTSAFLQFGRVALAGGRVLGGSRAILATPVEEALLPMLDDPPRCLLLRQGSVQRSFLPDGTTIGPNGDVDVFPMPGVLPGPAPLVVAGDTAVAFDDSDQTLALLRYLAEPTSGEPWARSGLGGFVSPHQSFDRAAYVDPFDRRVAELLGDAETVRFDGSDQMPPDVGTGTFWQGMTEYVSGLPLSTVLDEIEAGYGQPDDRPMSDGGSPAPRG